MPNVKKLPFHFAGIQTLDSPMPHEYSLQTNIDAYHNLNSSLTLSIKATKITKHLLHNPLTPCPLPAIEKTLIEKYHIL